MQSSTSRLIVSSTQSSEPLIDEDGQYRTQLRAYQATNEAFLEPDQTHFGIVFSGEIELSYVNRVRRLVSGDFFSLAGAGVMRVLSGNTALVSSSGYFGLTLFGGEIERTGRLRYIDGCTDSLLVPPVRKGDPCLNHLHFPENITQTPHTHPTVRAGIVLRGVGECITPEHDSALPLTPGATFLIRANCVHSFNTQSSSMDIIAFHPDSDVGVTDDDHPMINRTIVDGVSAREILTIRTK